MDYISFEVFERDNSKTILEWLESWCASKKKILQLEGQKAVLLNNENVPFNTILKESDIITIILDGFENNNYLPYKKYLEILYEDEDILIVNKPTGILIHPDGQSEETLGNIVSFYYSKMNLNRSIRHIHRLDFETSGCLIYAKHFLAQSFLDDQIQKGLIKRFYTAICHGKVTPKEGIINKRIGRNRHKAGQYIISNTGKEAITQYRVLKCNNNFSLLEIEIKNGRTHQIRVHLSSVDHPIVGDKIYGLDEGIRLMLHSSKVEFVHPRKRKVQIVTSLIPNEFCKIWR